MTATTVPTTIGAPAVAGHGSLSGTGSRAAGLVAAVGILAVVAVASLALGSRELDPIEVVRALLVPDGSTAHRIVLELRLPRTAVGLVVGMALGMAGVLMQGTTRNPLAEPGILGVSGGAALAVVLAISLLDTTDPARYVWFAMLGAALATLAVHALGRSRRRHVDPVRLVLAGAVLAMLLEACISTVLVLDAATLDRYRFWMVGSLAGRGTDVLVAVSPVLAVGALLCIWAGRSLDTLSLGDDVARSLGQRVTSVRLAASIAVVALAGAAVVLAGPIVFVGLAVPHVARALVGPRHGWLLLYAIVLGPILVIGADTLGRVVIRPAELQVGIMTALVGAPVLIWLVRRQRLAEV